MRSYVFKFFKIRIAQLDPLCDHVAFKRELRLRAECNRSLQEESVKSYSKHLFLLETTLNGYAKHLRHFAYRRDATATRNSAAGKY